MCQLYSRFVLAIIGLSLLASGAAYAANSKPVVIGSTNFTEQLVLGHIYADVLKAHNIPVKTRLNLGSREVVFPALKSGELGIIPGYTGALLDYLTKGNATQASQKAVLKAVRANLPKGIVALKPSSAQDKDALVVTKNTAQKYQLKKVSDLKGVAPKLIIGGPPELKTREVGLPGYKKVYGLHFKDFKALDAGGPLTTGALANGDIQVARMFTTQGIIQAKGWVVLKDDKGLIPADNIIPIARKAVLTSSIRKLLNKVSATLTTRHLREMNKHVTVDKRDPARVAKKWVEKHGLDD
jgi:osmoprotectant transport system substrate-binding protein